MKNLIIFALGVFLFACNSGETVTTTASEAPGLEGFEITSIPGSNFEKATKKDETGMLLEEGQLLKGQKVGSWVSFHPGEVFPKTLITYANGMANGPYFEFNNRGQMELTAFYKNNKLDGRWGTYKFGRPTKTANYVDGELDGTYMEYGTGNGKPKKEINYKNGKMHGKFAYYDDDGNVTLEYTYKNGEKVE